MEKLTVAMEDYLRAIYELRHKDVGVRVSDIALRMGVTKASVSQATAVLESNGLIIKGEHREIYLTSKGMRRVKHISSKHTIILEFFTEVLKVDPAVADKDACSFEHSISTESLRSIERYLKQHIRRETGTQIQNKRHGNGVME